MQDNQSFNGTQSRGIANSYVKSTQIYVCPSDKQDGITTGILASYGDSSAFGGYFSDVKLYDNAMTSANSWTPITAAQISRSAEVIMLMENSNSYVSLRASVATVSANAASPTLQYIVAPHLDGGNAVYADGHAKWQPRAKTAAWGGAGNCVPASYNVAPYNAYASCSTSWNPFIQ